MNIREDAIYGRQSVDRKDSISIESQAALCGDGLPGLRFPGTAGPFPGGGDGTLRLENASQLIFIPRLIAHLLNFAVILGQSMDRTLRRV